MTQPVAQLRELCSGPKGLAGDCPARTKRGSNIKLRKMLVEWVAGVLGQPMSKGATRRMVSREGGCGVSKQCSRDFGLPLVW